MYGRRIGPLLRCIDEAIAQAKLPDGLPGTRSLGLPQPKARIPVRAGYLAHARYELFVVWDTEVMHRRKLGRAAGRPAHARFPTSTAMNSGR